MKFAKLDLITRLNKIFPPSSTSIHQPGNLLEDVRIVVDALPASDVFSGAALQRFDSAAGAAASTPFVPTGFYWWVYAAEIFFSGVVSAHAGLSIADGAALNTVVLFTKQTGWHHPVTGALALVAPFETVYLERPIVVPQGLRLDAFRLPVDGASVTSLIICFRQVRIGEPFPSL